MRFSIQTRLTLALVGLTACLLIATLLLTRWSFLSGFGDYINSIEQTRLTAVATRLAELHDADSGWYGDIEQRFRRISHRPHRGQARRQGPPPLRPGRPGPGRRDPERSGPQPTAFFDAAGAHIAGADLAAFDVALVEVAIMSDGHVIGHVRSAPRRSVNGSIEAAFAKRQLKTTLLIGAVAFVLALLLSLALTRVVLTPIRRLLHGISELSAGNYAVELGTAGRDELGDLIRDFDRLAMTLRETQKARQQMFADISHELRTPLTILSAELEALRDGVRTFGDSTLTSFEQEVERLRFLIEDLYALSTSDVGGLRYTFADHDLRALVQSAVDSLPTEDVQGFEITTDLSPVNALIDARRIEQLLRNLLMNATAYTDRPGRIEVGLTTSAADWILTVTDSSPTVPAAQCAQLFEPLFRMEQSRNRRLAGSGLGLAICRKIVDAHRGTILAAPSALGGIRVTTTIPRR